MIENLHACVQVRWKILLALRKKYMHLCKYACVKSSTAPLDPPHPIHFGGAAPHFLADFDRPVAREVLGVRCTPNINLPKRSTFSHIMGQKLGLFSRVKGVRFKKSTFWGSRTPPKSILATGLDFDEKGVKMLRATFCFIWAGALSSLKHDLFIAPSIVNHNC